MSADNHAAVSSTHEFDVAGWSGSRRLRTENPYAETVVGLLFFLTISVEWWSREVFSVIGVERPSGVLGVVLMEPGMGVLSVAAILVGHVVCRRTVTIDPVLRVVTMSRRGRPASVAARWGFDELVEVVPGKDPWGDLASLRFASNRLTVRVPRGGAGALADSLMNAVQTHLDGK